MIILLRIVMKGGFFWLHTYTTFLYPMINDKKKHQVFRPQRAGLPRTSWVSAAGSRHSPYRISLCPCKDVITTRQRFRLSLNNSSAGDYIPARADSISPRAPFYSSYSKPGDRIRVETYMRMKYAGFRRTLIASETSEDRRIATF